MLLLAWYSVSQNFYLQSALKSAHCILHLTIQLTINVYLSDKQTCADGGWKSSKEGQEAETLRGTRFMRGTRSYLGDTGSVLCGQSQCLDQIFKLVIKKT